MEKIIEEYIFPSVTKEKIESFGNNIFLSIVVFILSLFARSEAYSLVSCLDISSFFYFFITNIISIIFVLFIFTIWVGFISAVVKKNVSVTKYFSGLLNLFSVYILLLPISLVFVYFGLKFLYYILDMFLSLYLINLSLRYTKLYYGFTKKEMFFIIGLPFIGITLLFVLPIIYLFFLFYGKI